MENITEDVSLYHEGDILAYNGNDERFDGQILVLAEVSVWESFGTLLWKTRDAGQGSFTEDYLTENYVLIGNINEMDAMDVSDDD